MKYHARDQVARIERLQCEALSLANTVKEKLKEADELTAELKAEFGSRFVCNDIPRKLEHRAVGFYPGNRDWLVADDEVKVIVHGD